MPREKISSMAAEYKKFCETVYDGGEERFGQDQRIQIKQAFYSGALVMFALMNQAAQEDLTVEQGAAIAQTFSDEIETFFRTQRQLHEGKTRRIHI